MRSSPSFLVASRSGAPGFVSFSHPALNRTEIEIVTTPGSLVRFPATFKSGIYYRMRLYVGDSGDFICKIIDDDQTK